jgi:hypothetical protein
VSQRRLSSGVSVYNTPSGKPELCDLYPSPNTTDGNDVCIEVPGGRLEMRTTDLRREGSGRLSFNRAVPGVTLNNGTLTITDIRQVPVKR